MVKTQGETLWNWNLLKRWPRTIGKEYLQASVKRSW